MSMPKYMNMYLSTMNIENYKYEISVLKNKNLKEEKERKNVEMAEKVISFSKNSSRLYCLLEIMNLIYKSTFGKSFKIRKVAFAYIRINIIWMLSNISTNIYLQKYSSLDKTILKYKNDNKNESTKFEFSQYIQHKNNFI